jgi:hypothetical protein
VHYEPPPEALAAKPPLPQPVPAEPEPAACHSRPGRPAEQLARHMTDYARQAQQRLSLEKQARRASQEARDRRLAQLAQNTKQALQKSKTVRFNPSFQQIEEAFTSGPCA